MTSPRRLLGLSALALFLAAPVLTAQVGPSPAARPRLSGGFGRPRPTPTPTPAGGTAAGARPGGKPGPRTGEKSRLSITNENLVTDPTKGKLTTTSRTAASAPGPTRTPAAGSPSRTVAEEIPFADSAPTSEAPSVDEVKWRAAARSARERVENLKQRIVEFEREAAKLESDFYAWDDGQYRDGVIKPAWDRKRDELEQARRDLVQAERDLADLPDRARKAGALPGWIRE